MASDTAALDLRTLIRDIPDFPKPGILFRDVTPLLGNGPALGACVRQPCARPVPARPQAIAGIESRGFILGSAVAPGTRVALVDDLLATGGTAVAAIKLLQEDPR